MKKNLFIAVIALAAAVAMTACTKKLCQLGTEKNPVKFHFVPSVHSKVIESN